METSPQDDLINHLRVLASALERGLVSLQGSRIPTEEILDLLIDLGLLLSQTEIHQELRNNQEIYEDPFDSTDELGNVRMIYRTPKSHRLFSPHIAQWGGLVAESAIRVKQQLKQEHLALDDFEEDFRLDLAGIAPDSVVVALESRKATKALISKLYKEFYRQERLIRKQYRYNQKLEKSLQKKKLVISSLHQRLKKDRRKH